MSEPIQWVVCPQCRGTGKAPFMSACPGCKGKGKLLVPKSATGPAAAPQGPSPKEVEEMLGALNAALTQAHIEKATMLNALAQLQAEGAAFRAEAAEANNLREQFATVLGVAREALGQASEALALPTSDEGRDHALKMVRNAIAVIEGRAAP